MITTSILLDVVVVGLLVGCALYYRHKGFLSSIIVLVGSLVALLVGLFAGNRMAPLVFNSLFRNSMVTRTAAAIEAHGGQQIDAVLGQELDFLPESARESAIARADGFENISAGMAETMVDKVIAPLIIPMISVVLFLLFFLLLRLLFGVLAKVLSGVNAIPVVGGANRALGLITGILVGALYGFLVLCCVWALDAVYGGTGFGQEWFGSSIIYNVTQKLNLFT